jgi:PKD repeat protein
MRNALLILTILVSGLFCSCQKNPPVASFECSPATGDAPLSVQFENTSTNGEVFEWNFDDGEKSSEENPSHTFASAGSYTVVLKVSNNDGVDMTMNTVKVEEGIEAPTASFTCSKTTAKKDETVNFTNTSTFGETYEWSFGDGTTATTKDASHAYSTIGSYTVILKVKNIKGADVTSQSITINLIGSGGGGGGDITTGDFASAIEGVYGGSLKSGSSYNETPYVIKLVKKTQTVVSMECDMGFLSNINFNIREENGNYYLTNATLDATKVSIRVSGSVMEITFTNAGGDQTSYIGKKDDGLSTSSTICSGRYSGTLSSSGDDAYIVELEYVSSTIVRMIDERKNILADGSANIALTELAPGYYKLSNSLYNNIDMTIFVGTSYTELRMSYVSKSGSSVTYNGKK